MFERNIELTSQHIKMLREQLGYSQEDLAQRLDVSVRTVAQWEQKGWKTRPRLHTRRLLEKLIKKIPRVIKKRKKSKKGEKVILKFQSYKPFIRKKIRKGNVDL